MNVFWCFQKGTEKALHYIFRASVRVRACINHTAGTFFPETPGIFYVFLSENVCFRPGKRTFPGRETYVSPDGNIEILKATENYPTGISSIRNAWRKKNGTFEKQTGRLQEKTSRRLQERQKKQLEGKLTEKRTNKRTAQQTEKKETSPTGIKKGVPLNSNLC